MLNYVILYVKHKTITISCGFNLISNSWYSPRWRPLLVTSQASSSATTHKILPYLVWKIKGFPLKAKSFRNTATNQKELWGGVPSSAPCTTVGV